MFPTPHAIKIRTYCNVLRDDGMSYGDYVGQLTYLLFLKMADERTKPPYSQPVRFPTNILGPASSSQASPASDILPHRSAPFPPCAHGSMQLLTRIGYSVRIISRCLMRWRSHGGISTTRVGKR
jgi:hypothetical protein